MQVSMNTYRLRNFYMCCVCDLGIFVENDKPLTGYYRDPKGNWYPATWAADGHYERKGKTEFDVVGPWRAGFMTRDEWRDCGGNDEDFTSAYRDSKGLVQVDNCGNIKQNI